MSHHWRDWRRQVLVGLGMGRWDAVMAQYRLIDDSLLQDVQDRGGQLYAWTVNQRPLIDRLRSIGVHGITTGDPRLFA
jgi:glycerophosphoryl diester phosphodiesterase